MQPPKRFRSQMKSATFTPEGGEPITIPEGSEMHEAAEAMDPTVRTEKGQALRGDLITTGPRPISYAARFSAYLSLQLSALLGSLGFTQRQNVPRDLWPHLEGMAASRAHHDVRYGGTSWHPPGGAYFASNAHKRAKLRARTGRR